MKTETFLNDAEMHDLTGFKQPAKQAEVLRKNGIPFFINGRGYPRVIRENLSSSMAKPARKKQAWNPAA